MKLPICLGDISGIYMPKIYAKTILLAVFVTVLTLLRLNLLRFSLFVPGYVLDILMMSSIVAIIINEKLTRGERWHKAHYALLLIVFILILWLRLMLAQKINL